MLNPPLSLLSVELLDSIVDHIAQDLWPEGDLKSLALADRCFTPLCQKHIFKEFVCASRHDGGDWKQQLRSFHYALTTNPSVSSWVKAITLVIHARIKGRTWVFHEAAFTSILAQLGSTDSPPTALGVHTSSDEKLPFREPDLVLKVVSESLAPGLVKLSLSFCDGVPMELFLLLPKLKELNLDHIFPRLDPLCHTDALPQRSSPALDTFSFRYSHEMLEQLLAPITEQDQSVIDFSTLRILEFAPSDEEAFPSILKILERAQKSLEELIPTRVKSPRRDYVSPVYMPITSYLDLRILHRLRTLHLDAPISCEDPQASCVVADLADAFRGVPESNNLRNIFLTFSIIGYHPFDHAQSQGWSSLAREISRLASGRVLDVEIYVCISGVYMLDCDKTEGRRELYDVIKGQMDEVWGNEPYVHVEYRTNGVPGI
ncbi:hypothetical protein BKA70DRAFT_1270400, partial [Coprinopsis sp. MPI-PUGE-AT-0042]